MDIASGSTASFGEFDLGDELALGPLEHGESAAELEEDGAKLAKSESWSGSVTHLAS